MDRQQRAADVARTCRLQQRQQLVLRAVGVPQRKILVVGPAIGAMDRIVVAAIAAIGIAAGERLQQGMIQRGVGHAAIVVAGAFQLHAGQRIAPGLLRALAHLFKTQQLAALHAIGTQVAAGALGIHMRDGADHGHRTRILVFCPAGS
ncbi:hypothetical protein ADT25_18905 [Xanthomonas oryzae]|uniref:Uncharacterized protein n=1 Tax=Xanthomonas oryzae TaxID=347 RepID=A0AAP0ZIH7_9XANT|nr:hypothetical protein ADT25_18905 [Xanthomonas oryzae]